MFFVRNENIRTDSEFQTKLSNACHADMVEIISNGFKNIL